MSARDQRDTFEGMARSDEPALLCSVQVLHPLLRALAKLDVDRGRVLARVGLTFEQLADPELRIPYCQTISAWEAAYELADDPALGLHVVEHLDLEDFSLFRYLSATSATSREAYERTKRYVRVVHDAVQVELSVEGERTICRTNAGEWSTGPWAAEYGVGMMIKLAPTVVGEPIGISAWFEHDEPDYVDEYHRVLGVPIRFGAPCNAIVGSSDRLDHPLPRADSALCALIEQHAAELLAKVPDTTTFADTVRQRIAATLPHGSPTAEEIARGLGMSARTLRRRLSELGTRHQKLVDEVRCDLAERALVERGISVNEVAYLLGFSDASAFAKAFRRWTGRTPREVLSERRAARG